MRALLPLLALYAVLEPVDAIHFTLTAPLALTLADALRVLPLAPLGILPVDAIPLPTAALLVLRAACIARDPNAFTPLLEKSEHRPLRVLGYEDTCGPGWSVSVTRESLSVMSSGGVVAIAGWPGAAACEALTAAASALRRPRPAVCALPTARAEAVSRIAVRLGWRRAVLPPAPPRSECHNALQEVARALAIAGVTTVALAPRSSDELTLLSHVVILCASRESGVGGEAGVQLARGAGAVLLLHVEEPARPAPPDPTHLTNEALSLSNIDLVLDTLSYFRSKETLLKRSSVASGDSISRKLTFRTLVSNAEYISRIKRSSVSEVDPARDDDVGDDSLVGEDIKIRQIATSELTRVLMKRTVRARRPDYLFYYIDKSLPRRNLLLLSAERLDEDRAPRDLEQVYEEALDAVEKAMNAESTRTETADFTFHLYHRPEDEERLTTKKWQLAGTVATTSQRALDDSGEWLTEVQVGNASDALERLSKSQISSGRRKAGFGAVAATLLALSAVALAAVAALTTRWVTTRRRRRRRGGDAVLSPSDFSFPADERRCVGDGMETMLSCWLQQLHEFGGPDLERPDLLKQPPHASSAPSSTCSVNRIAQDRRIRYKGDSVHVKPLQTTGALELKRKAVDVLLVMQSLRHENLNPFIGCLCEARPALVFDHCGRGSLEDVLMADDIKLDWTFRLSLLTDLVKGMRYLHACPLRVHGRLTSRNCVVDSRWVLRLTDYGAPAFHRAQQLPHPTHTARELLWTAPELLRDEAACARGSQPGDVYSFAIIMQEVIVRGEPYCMLALTPEEIIEKLSRPPPLIRPSVSMGAAPPEAVSVMRQCWSESPDLRPDFHRLHDLFRHLHRGRKINIVDSMFEMLEKYSNNLEELIKERTEQLDMEKKKTEQLLNRMLPKSVAERLLLGSRVEPEEFEEVSIYFSDIVGFTALAARSTPVQVVDLLNDLYTTFDAAIERYRVYKVETIGDAYMVVGGLPTRARDHAESVATMALHLLHLAGRFRVRHLPDTPLHLRIGLHSGPVCAAVVGLTMPRYCLFGDTVNTASRMESTGAAWRIQVSAATSDRLTAAGGYRLRSRGLTQIKGKGAMHTYWLLGKDGFDKPLPTPPPLESEEVLFETEGENESEASSGPPSATTASTREPLPLLDLTATQEDSVGWQQSGAVSADSSPPHEHVRPPRDRMMSAASIDRAPAAPYSRYRWLGNGNTRTLRRQWSLERGEVLATAAASLPALAPQSPPPSEPQPLALLSSGPRPQPPRYRMRPEPTDEPP